MELDRIQMKLYTVHKSFSVSGYFQGIMASQEPWYDALGFFLWGTLKNKVYETTPANLKQLKEKITSEIPKISQQTLKKVFRNLLHRAITCESVNFE